MSLPSYVVRNSKSDWMSTCFRAMEAVTSMRASVLAATSTSDFDDAMSGIAGIIPPELRKVLTGVIDQAKAKADEIAAEMKE